MQSCQFRPKLEALEDRTVPAAFEPGYIGGVLLVTPPSANAHAQSTVISHQLGNTALPTGDAFPAHGLKLADAQTPVVTWTPT